MSVVRPFKALRPVKNMVEEFSCPPYDVLEENEVREIVKNHPESFLRVTRAEVEFSGGDDPHSEAVYKKASENLRNYEEKGIIVQDSPCFYIYRETWRGKSQTGLFATVSVDEYDQGKIKKHELTRQDKEDDRAMHIEILNAQTGPVFLTYKSDPEIKNILIDFTEKSEKIYDFTDENSVHQEMWRVSENSDIEKIRLAFSKLEALYIADGHHRAAAASRAQKNIEAKTGKKDENAEYNYFLAAMFPHDEMRVLDYNRVVKDLNGLSSNEFIKKISDSFVVEEASDSPYSPENVHNFGMYLNKKWYKLTAKKEISEKNDPVQELDVYILQEYLLNPVLGIENPRKDSRIHFLGGIRGLNALEEWIDGKNWGVAFSMFPTPLEQLINVADAGKIMPPKSTWFEPKLRSGLVIHKL